MKATVTWTTRVVFEFDPKLLQAVVADPELEFSGVDAVAEHLACEEVGEGTPFWVNDFHELYNLVELEAEDFKTEWSEEASPAPHQPEAP